MSADDAATPGAERTPLWPRMLGLGVVFLFLVVVGIVTVWVPELRDDADPSAEGAAAREARATPTAPPAVAPAD